jgi:uncharacterized protein YjbJ (UPF0337 family)
VNTVTWRTLAFEGHALNAVCVWFGPPRACIGGKEIEMKDSTKDKIEGGAHQVKGAVKEKVGRAIKKPDLEAEGADEKLGGKIQKKVGDVEKVLEK